MHTGCSDLHGVLKIMCHYIIAPNYAKCRPTVAVVVFNTTATVIYSLGHRLHSLPIVPTSTQDFHPYGMIK